MEIVNENKTGFTASLLGSLVLMLGGVTFIGYLLSLIPSMEGITLGRYALCAVAAFLPIAGGATWFGILYRRGKARRGGSSMANGIVLGVLVIAVGILLFCFSTGIIMPEWRKVFLSWQMLLIVAGVLELCKLHGIGGVTLLTVGNFFLIPRIIKVYPHSWNIEPDFVATYWPVLLILFGLLLVAGVVMHRNKTASEFFRDEFVRDLNNNGNCDKTFKNRTAGISADASGKDGFVDYNLIFTGSEQVFLEPVFRGGRISVVFAGMELDLRRTTLPEGVTYLKVDATFGGVELKVPEDWSVEIRSNSIFGGFTDKRHKYITPESDGRKLVITTNCTFGGGEID